MKADQRPQPAEPHPAPKAPTRGSAPARGIWRMVEGLPCFWEELPVLGGIIPQGETMRPDPERARLAAEALARARADAWARGDRPGAGPRQQNQSQDSERPVVSPPAATSSSWSARP